MQSRHFGLAGKKTTTPSSSACRMLQLRLWGMTLRFIGVVAELHLKLLLVVLFFSCWYGGQRCCWWEWGCRDVSGGGRDASLFIVFPSTALCTQLLSAASLLIAAGGSEKRQSFLSRCPKTIQILQHHFILLYVMCNYIRPDAGTLRFNIHCSDRICFGMITLVFRWKHTLVFYFFLQLHKATTYFDSSVGWKVTWDLLNSSSQKQIKPGPVTLVITQQDVGTTTQSV